MGGLDPRRSTADVPLRVAPGHYVLAGRYDDSGGVSYGTFRDVTITAGTTIRADLPNVCS